MNTKCCPHKYFKAVCVWSLCPFPSADLLHSIITAHYSIHTFSWAAYPVQGCGRLNTRADPQQLNNTYEYKYILKKQAVVTVYCLNSFCFPCCTFVFNNFTNAAWCSQRSVRFTVPQIQTALKQRPQGHKMENFQSCLYLLLKLLTPPACDFQQPQYYSHRRVEWKTPIVWIRHNSLAEASGPGIHVELLSPYQQTKHSPQWQRHMLFWLSLMA